MLLVYKYDGGNRMEEVVKRGRSARKLTFEQAEEIRKLYYSDTLNQYELARKYNVSQSTIFSILTRRNYKK